MAESVVSFVLEKLADAVVKETLHLYGVGEQVQKVSKDLTMIQAFLKDADRKRIVDERQKQWVKDVRDVAYQIEDVIDTFLTELPEKIKRPGKIEAFLKRPFRKIKKLPALHNIGNDISEIQATIQEINERRLAFGITDLGESAGGQIRQPVKPIFVPGTDDPNVVGFEDHTRKIIGLLLDESTTRRSVISIVGSPGLGKTTLARKAYASEDIKQFDLHIWIDVSQTFELINILKKMANQLEIQPADDLSDYRQLAILTETLSRKRYILVLDDIWTNNLWTQIEYLLPNANNGSRILITTRFANVARFADPTSKPYQLPFLEEGPSLELFFKKALPNLDANERYSGDLYRIGKQLAEKCSGLPLALVVLGGLLSTKSVNYDAWSKVLQTMDWSIDGGQCMMIINTSYEDLPFALKSCLMYFAAFPEDYEIDAVCLQRLWIAEGFIPKEGNKSLEDTAESFLEDLLQRSMIQAKRLHNGSISFYRVHDVLHDFVIRKAKDENFLMVCSKIDDLQICSQTRRLAIRNSGGWCMEDAKIYGESMKSATPKLRSLFCFDPVPNLSRHRLLKVLHSTRAENVKPMSLRTWQSELEMPDSLSQLRYFSVRLSVNSEEGDIFEKFISSMSFLQTLDLRNSMIDVDLPDCVWHIKTLRHVWLPYRQIFISGPSPSVELRNLQTLSHVRSRESWETAGLPKFPNLKELSIELCNQSQWDTLATLLDTLEHLTFLSIRGIDIPLKLIDMRGFPFYEHLRVLYLIDTYGPCGKKITFDVGMFPVHLTQLSLVNLQLREDPMPVLEKLENLKVLSLSNGCKIQQMRCSAGGFSQLEQLQFYKLDELEEWKIEEGAMPMLEELDVLDCPLLRVPLGLQHVATLNKLTWEQEEEEFLDKMKDMIRSICKHFGIIFHVANSFRLLLLLIFFLFFYFLRIFFLVFLFTLF